MKEEQGLLPSAKQGGVGEKGALGWQEVPATGSSLGLQLLAQLPVGWGTEVLGNPLVSTKFCGGSSDLFVQAPLPAHSPGHLGFQVNTEQTERENAG